MGLNLCSNREIGTRSCYLCESKSPSASENHSSFASNVTLRRATEPSTACGRGRRDPAQDHEPVDRLFESAVIVASEVCDLLEVRLEATYQADDLNTSSSRWPDRIGSDRHK
jgi:hypothetical protein